MGPCQQGKLSKCSHSFQRGALKEPAVSLVASGGHQSCTVGLMLVPCVPGFGMPCTCTQKLVLSLVPVPPGDPRVLLFKDPSGSIQTHIP